MATRKRKVTYPVPRTSKKPGPPPGVVGESTYQRNDVVAIDLRAGSGRDGLAVGDRVRIAGSGLYAGETAVIERFAGSAIPAAVVRTEAGRTRQVRTIDLEPIASSEG